MSDLDLKRGMTSRIFPEEGTKPKVAQTAGREHWPRSGRTCQASGQSSKVAQGLLERLNRTSVLL